MNIVLIIKTVIKSIIKWLNTGPLHSKQLLLNIDLVQLGVLLV